MGRLLLLALVLVGCRTEEPPSPDTPAILSGRLRVPGATGSSSQGLDATRAPTGVSVPAPVGGETPLPLGGGRLAERVVRVDRPVPQEDARILPGEVLVGLEAQDVSADAALASLGVPGLTVEHAGFSARHLHLLRFHHVGGEPLGTEETLALVDALGLRPGVAYAAPNRRHVLHGSPTDPLYPAQWHYRALNLPAAWERTHGAPEGGAPGVVVAVVDSGVWRHPELVDRLVPGLDTISDPANAEDGDGRDLDPTDPPVGGLGMHGTHVAGTVGAASDNGQGVAGVSWDVRLLPVRALGRQGGTTADVLAGISWAVGEPVPGVEAPNANPAQVVNLSLGTRGAPDAAYQDVIDRAVARGVVFVVAAGNEGEPAALSVPCNQRNVLCVGATRLDGRRTSYSNYGPQVDVTAPGGQSDEDLDGDGLPDGVLSTWVDRAGRPAYAFMDGTSMAAPHVSGVVALMKAVAPAFTHAEVESALRSTAVASFQCPEGCGAGLVNAQGAVLRAAGLPAPGGPARLAVPTAGLALDDARERGVTLVNAGGAPLTVAASFTPGTPGGALAFPAGETVEVPPGEERVLRVEAGRGVLPGSYAGTLTLLPQDGAAQTLPVHLHVSQPPELRPAQVLVYMVSGLTGRWDVRGRALARPEDGYAFSLEVEQGFYFATAAIDEDEDGVLFEAGERVGHYPAPTEQRPFLIAAGEHRSGMDLELVPYTPPEERWRQVVGSACRDGGDCQGALCETSLPGGYCTLDCSHQACPPGTACSALGEALRCMSSCSHPGGGQSTCRDGQVCHAAPDPGVGFCLPRCTADADCGAGRCDTGTGSCME